MCYVLNDTVASKFTPAHRRSGEARPLPHHPAPSEKSAQKTG